MAVNSSLARSLDVYLLQHLAGRLHQDDRGQIHFQYAPDWIENKQAIPLSQSMPLRAEPYQHDECIAFFNGVLPEESQRISVARNLGISAENDFALLELIGGECAGAVSFVPQGAGIQSHVPKYQNVDEKKLADTLRQLPDHPLLAGEVGIRLSLAGAQSKLAVHVSVASIGIPLGNAPSTHILKPASQQFKALVENEALCLNLARKIGLNAAYAVVGRAEDIEYLLIERFDRRLETSIDGEIDVQRLHQEDFCQALGMPSSRKYQIEGGPSLQQCFDLVREVSSAPVLDLPALLDAVIFNYLICNNDAHGKNFSLLYSKSQGEALQTRLAPLYDLVCTTSYKQLSKSMAMSIGNEFDSSKIMPRHFERLSIDAGLSKKFAVSRVPEMASSILEVLTEVAEAFPQAANVAELIEKRSRRTLEAFS